VTSLTLIDPATNAPKFWTIGRDDGEVRVTYGRTGASGQTQINKAFGDALAAKRHAGVITPEGYRNGCRVTLRPRQPSSSLRGPCGPESTRSDSRPLPRCPADLAPFGECCTTGRQEFG